MAIEIQPKVIKLLPTGIVEFLNGRTGPVIATTRWTTEIRQTGIDPVLNANKLWFSFENNTHADVYVDVRELEDIISPGPVIQSYTALGPTPTQEDYDVRQNEVYEYLVNVIFRGCCSVGDSPIPGPYIVKTYAEWEAIRLAGDLPVGLWVGVTDIPSQPSATFALFCKEADAFGLGGFGTFLNADWQNVGDYSGVFAITGVAFTSNIGQWYAGLEGSAVDGDVVIWNCLHYQVVDAASFAGTDPATNTTAYTLLPKATANTGYISEVDDIEFDFPNDWLQYWADKRGNTYRYSQSADVYFSLGFTGIDLFQKGRDSWFGNNIDNGLISQINFVGIVRSNNISPGGKISGNTGGDSASGISANSVLSDASISNNIFSDGGSISGNLLISAGKIENNTLQTGANMSGNTIEYLQTIENKTIDVAINYSQNTIGLSQTFSETIVTTIQVTTHIPGNSTQQRDLDVTGGGTIDIGSNAELVGIYNLTSSNPTETITDFVDGTWPTLFPFTLKPVAGLIVTINFTAVGSLSASGQIVDGSSFIVLDGDNGDSATFETATIGIYNVVKLVEVIQNT